jgi:shikimate dehydrogenase
MSLKKLGLIGYPLSHSFSKKYFSQKFQDEGITGYQYELYPIENITQLPALLQAEQLHGLNVTIPYKIEVMPYLTHISPEATEAGAVNCISINRAANGQYQLTGYNTDVYGFEMSLRPLLGPQHTQALILGNGGAARAVKYVLAKLGIIYQVVARKPADGVLLFNDLTPQHIQQYKLIINTTPVGTSPKVEECPTLPYQAIGNQHVLFDLIYNPEETLFLTKGLQQGATIKNGYQMLILQAERAWQIWNQNL